MDTLWCNTNIIVFFDSSICIFRVQMFNCKSLFIRPISRRLLSNPTLHFMAHHCILLSSLTARLFAVEYCVKNLITSLEKEAWTKSKIKEAHFLQGPFFRDTIFLSVEVSLRGYFWYKWSRKDLHSHSHTHVYGKSRSIWSRLKTVLARWDKRPKSVTNK